MNKIAMAFVVSSSLGLVASAASIENVLVRQQWPWSPKVNVDYVLKDASGGVHDVKVTFRNGQQVLTNLTEAISGERYGVGDGAHTLTWDPTYGGAVPDKKVLTDVTATVSIADDAKQYMVIDMSGGPDAAAFPVEFVSAPPAGGWNQDIYKGTAATTKLVLRRIPATTFRTGMTEAETNHFPLSEYPGWVAHDRRTVTLTHDYYIGIFETTVLQCKKISGGSSNQYDKRPNRSVTYGYVRGNTANSVASWPNYEADSFLDKLNKKVAATLATALPGYKIELPTWAQWECACRGGVDTCFNNGKNWASDGTAEVDANLAVLGWYAGNQPSDLWQDVGQKTPNAFGLYDMHGNVMELVRDTMWGNRQNGLTDPQTDPLLRDDSGYQSYKVWACGGGVMSPAKDCLCNSIKHNGTPTDTFNSSDPRYYTGFRLACVYIGE